MPIQRFVLKAGNPVPCASEAEWFAFVEDFASRTLAVTFVGDVKVATFFNGIAMIEPGTLWETSVFAPSWQWLPELNRLYKSRQDALDGHKEVIEILKAARKKKIVPYLVKDQLMTWAIGEA